MEEEVNVVNLQDQDSAFDGVQLITEKVEYFRKKGKIIGDQILTDPDNGDRVFVPDDGSGRRAKGTPKGVMIAYVPEGESVVRIGFSMCHPTDRWDYVDGAHVPGWGKQIASERGEKWMMKTNVHRFKDVGDFLRQYGVCDVGLQKHLKESVIVPDSMLESLTSFISRCQRYYKDKLFPAWANKLVGSSVCQCECTQCTIE